MKKRIITNIFITIITISLVCLILGRILVAGQTSFNYTKEELINLITEQEQIKLNAHIMAESARALSWNDDSSLIKELQDRWHAADKLQKDYQAALDKIIAIEEEAARQAEAKRIAEEARKVEAEIAARAAEEAKWATKSVEYPVATKIWRYMKNLGWNDYVCAGIMGNLMAEVGGQTLDIRYASSSSGYYGMCQWSRGYSKVWGAGLETQCDFLRDTIKYEIDTYGFKYQKGFNFNSFLNMTDEQQAALAFAKTYERCASGSYNIRQKNAVKAYEYFVNN